MKKLLSILAAVGLTATSAASVVACGNTPEKDTNTQEVKVPKEAILIVLRETQKGDKTLRGGDKVIVQNAILKKLKDLNSDVVIYDEKTDEHEKTFTIPDSITPQSTEVEITIKSTEAKDDKKGLKEGTASFKLNLVLGQIKAKTPSTAFKIDVETEEGKNLNDKDKANIQEKIKKGLVDENPDAVTNDDTFVAQLDDTLVSKTEQKIKVKVKETQGSKDQYGLTADDVEVKVKLTPPASESSLTEKIQEIVENGLTLWEISDPNPENVTKDDLEKNLAQELNQFKGLEIATKDDFDPIHKGENKIENGQATFTFTFQGKEVINPDNQENPTEWTIAFINKDSYYTNEALDYLAKGQVEVNLTDFPIELGPLKTTIGFLLTVARPVLDQIPEKVPTAFDNSDSNWAQWENTLDYLRGLLSEQAGIDIDEPMVLLNKTLDEMSGLTPHIEVSLTISDLLTSVLPDLIHFKNFLKEQQELHKKENVILLLIQYLFETPKDINNDGFSKVNQKIEELTEGDHNGGGGIPTGNYLHFETNLDHLLHNLVEGWQNEKGENVRETGDETVAGPLDVKIWMLKSLESPDTPWEEAKSKTRIKYQTYKRELGVNVLYTVTGIKDILLVDNLKTFVNSLLDYDFINPDPEKPLSLKLVFPTSAIGNTDIDIPLGLESTITEGLGNILNTDQKLNGKLNNLAFDWKQGRLNIEILEEEDKEENWVLAKNFDEILKAKDLRVKFANNNLEAKYNDWTFDLENINIILNLDITTRKIIS